MTLRLVRDTAGTPLGADAYERVTPEAVAELWSRAVRLPIPDYSLEVLAKLPGLVDRAA